ncbi:MAG: hypothetical protein C0601_08260 [Candidatus Muiribacterium halophilum]|uniref:Uncharacterized protein n=1 Tax=Muiribacterium halophilum TaxID=2053465 RepID=A0A2N5ZEQ8_MUIH1|nr:MAG: hypothetical protein C0601_08260 [Candidatus Muirbacterium halophilum]
MFLRGLSFIEKELFEKAHNDFDRCIEIIPQFSRAYAEKAFIYSKQGKAEDALDYFTKAIELEKDNPIFLYNRSLVLNALERFNEAKNDLDEVIKIDENFIHAYRLRASIYEKLKNEDEFQRDMKKFFELKHEMENRESVKSEK